jgi:hypothetical protein
MHKGTNTMSGQGAATLAYTVTYVPESYYVEEVQALTVAHGPVYWTINSKETGRQVAFAFDENMAKTICLSLELIRAQVHGDTKKATQILKLIDKLAQPTLFQGGGR